MMPTFLADGTVLAEDVGSLFVPHTTAHGKWIVSEDDGLPDRPGTQRVRATFFWLQGGPGGTFAGSLRPRFVAYFDPKDPDRMIGFLQPYFFPFVNPDTGLIRVEDKNKDIFMGNHSPLKALDPLGGDLPPGCDLAKGCLATYHFIIRRTPVK